MRYPGRGRKTLHSHNTYACTCYWEMRYPGRGRKLFYSGTMKYRRVQLRNEIPRKGTETEKVTLPLNIRKLLRNEPYWEMRYPGRGRKPHALLHGRTRDSPLRNEIPRKGTETGQPVPVTILSLWLRNEIPRKGTETDIPLPQEHGLLKIEKWDTPEGDGNQSGNFQRQNGLTHWEMRYPGRGRKQWIYQRETSDDHIEKWDTPEGDGNGDRCIYHHTATTIEKWDTPEGDGNNSDRRFFSAPISNWEMRYPGRGRKPCTLPSKS